MSPPFLPSIHQMKKNSVTQTSKAPRRLSPQMWQAQNLARPQ